MDIFSTIGGIASIAAFLSKDTYLAFEGKIFFENNFKLNYRIENKELVEFKTLEIVRVIDQWFNYKLFSIWNKIFRRILIPTVVITFGLQIFSLLLSLIPSSRDNMKIVYEGLGSFINIFSILGLIMFVILFYLYKKRKKTSK